MAQQSLFEGHSGPSQFQQISAAGAVTNVLGFSQDAQSAAEKTQGWEMDKKHKWQVCMFDDFDKLDKVPDDYEEPPPLPYKPLVRPCRSCINPCSLRTGNRSCGAGIPVGSGAKQCVWALVHAPARLPLGALPHTTRLGLTVVLHIMSAVRPPIRRTELPHGIRMLLAWRLLDACGFCGCCLQYE